MALMPVQALVLVIMSQPQAAAPKLPHRLVTTYPERVRHHNFLVLGGNTRPVAALPRASRVALAIAPVKGVPLRIASNAAPVTSATVAAPVAAIHVLGDSTNQVTGQAAACYARLARIRPERRQHALCASQAHTQTKPVQVCALTAAFVSGALRQVEVPSVIRAPLGWCPTQRTRPATLQLPHIPPRL